MHHSVFIGLYKFISLIVPNLQLRVFTNFAVTRIPEREKHGHYLEGIYIKSWREIDEVKEKSVSSFVSCPLSLFLFSLSKYTKYTYMNYFEEKKMKIFSFDPE